MVKRGEKKIGEQNRRRTKKEREGGVRKGRRVATISSPYRI